MLQVKNLLCARDEAILFKRVNFALKPGSAIQIMGRNGSGKTTLLRTLVGLLKPFAGHVRGGRNVCYVGHQAGMHPDLSVIQNLSFIQTFLPTNKECDAYSALQQFNLQATADLKFGSLSQGQAQLVSLSRLSLTTAKLWVLDEPLAHLDTNARELLHNLCMRHLFNNGALVIATHMHLDLAPNSCENINLEAY